MASTGHGEAVNLRLHVDALFCGLLQPGNIYLNVEMTNTTVNASEFKVKRSVSYILANDSILGHLREMSASDNVPISSGSDKDVGARRSFFHRRDFVTSHRGLEGVDGVDFGHEDTGTVRAERLGALS
jgi:hypothetical protein